MDLYERGREGSFKLVFSRLLRILADLIFELMYSGYNPVGRRGKGDGTPH